jgi:hypothetical protein
MAKRKSGTWSDSTFLARAILQDRLERRKWLGRILFVPLIMMGIGLWGIHDWIWQNPWRVLLWWGSCAFATCIVILFAIYDALAVIREERVNAQSDKESG